MPTSHTVQLGDCFGSLARQYGFSDYAVVRDDGANAQLVANRPNPNVLKEGDVVSVPDRVLPEFGRATDVRHRFVLQPLPTLLRITLQDSDAAAISGKKYRLKVGSATFDGSTAASGIIEHPIDAGATRGTLELWITEGDGIEGYSFELELGSLEHSSQDRACQARLLNLGFDCGGTGGTVDSATRKAVRGFKKKNGLTVNAILDTATRQKLTQVHDGA